MICYKVVRLFNGKRISAFARTFECEIEYVPKQVIVPQFGLIFAYQTPHDCPEHSENTELWECETTNIIYKELQVAAWERNITQETIKQFWTTPKHDILTETVHRNTVFVPDIKLVRLLSTR